MARPCNRCEYANSDEAKFCLQCGSMLEVEAADGGDPLIGKILLGRYRVVQILGEGGMGKVYLAEQKMGTATRKVAIKTLHPELSGDPQLVARFHRECETVIELHHPNTVQFYDFGDLDDKTLFIVMEFIKGEDLAHRLRRGALDSRTCDKVLIQICGSLNEAHQRGVVHRDLKPENVLLTTRSGQTDFVKVLDFGIAKRSEAEDENQAKLTKQGMVLGTPPYMSPEQFSGQTLDARSDIYSLGVMTYEMITGRLPFEAKTPWEWATKHLTAQPTPLDAHPAGAQLPPNKRDAIMRALSKDRNARQADVLTFMYEFTGLHDAQVAWTMATTSGLAAQTAGQQNPSQPPQVASPVIDPTPSTSFTGSSTQALPTNNRMIGLMMVGFVLFGGLAGGGLWWLNRGPDVPENGVVGTVGHGTPQTNTGETGTMTSGTGMQATMEAGMQATMETTMAQTMTPVMQASMQPSMEATTTPVMEAVMEATMESTMMTSMRSGPSAAQIATANNAVRQGEAALASNNFRAAADALRRAQRAVGRNHRSLRAFKAQLTSRGARAVGNFLVRGDCPSAQNLYRTLRSAGVSSRSGGHFNDEWCRRP